MKKIILLLLVCLVIGGCGEREKFISSLLDVVTEAGWDCERDFRGIKCKINPMIECVSVVSPDGRIIDCNDLCSAKPSETIFLNSQKND